jgi:hypothetical protein
MVYFCIVEGAERRLLDDDTDDGVMRKEMPDAKCTFSLCEWMRILDDDTDDEGGPGWYGTIRKE